MQKLYGLLRECYWKILSYFPIKFWKFMVRRTVVPHLYAHKRSNVSSALSVTSASTKSSSYLEWSGPVIDTP